MNVSNSIDRNGVSHMINPSEDSRVLSDFSNILYIFKIFVSAPSARNVLPVPSKHRTIWRLAGSSVVMLVIFGAKNQGPSPRSQGPAGASVSSYLYPLLGSRNRVCWQFCSQPSGVDPHICRIVPNTYGFELVRLENGHQLAFPACIIG